jgi:acyl-CoA thioester hydrolase
VSPLFRTVIQPRVSETDGAGHINNTTVPVWFEAGRQEIFKMFMPDLSFRNWKLVVVSINIDYLHQIYYGRDVEVRTWVRKIGNSSFVLYEELHQNGNRCARGTATYVNYNFETRRSEPIPPALRKRLEEHLLPETEA